MLRLRVSFLTFGGLSLLRLVLVFLLLRVSFLMFGG